MQLTLTVIEGPHRGATFSFRHHDTFIVGRGDEAHFRLPRDDRYFSRTHFMIEVNPPACVLWDLRSRNGTFVNGQRVESVPLCHGDIVKGGQTEIRVLVADDDTADSVSGAAREAAVFAAGDVDERNQRVGPSPPVAEPAHLQTRVAQQHQVVRGYHLVDELGRGGMGVVYRAVRQADGVVVAVKTIRPSVAADQRSIQRFLREASILRELVHPQIVSFHDMGYAAGMVYFVMEYVPGSDLATILRQRTNPMPSRQAVPLICQVLEALAHAHECGFVHRDVKPANLLVTDAGGRLSVKLTDFGLARVYHTSAISGLTLMGDLGGTFSYIAPEQITNYRESRPPVDQFSAAATLYFMLTGSTLYDFPDDARGKVLKILQEPPVPITQRRADVLPPLAAAIHRALARDPAARFPDCRVFRDALRKSVGLDV
jgi:serine/threonine-protein kinase